MTKGDIDIPWMVRPIKPVAAGTIVLMLTLAISNMLDADRLHTIPLGYLVALIAMISATCLVMGFAFGKQRAAEAGLLLAFVTYVLRSSFLLLTEGPLEPGIYLGIGVCVISGGAYVLERWDDPKKQKQDETV